MSEFLVIDVKRRNGVPAYQVVSLAPTVNEYALIIPVINENVRLTRQLEQLREFHSVIDIFIADGQSTDGSTLPRLLKDAGVNSLLTILSPGKLSAQLRMAIDHCMQRGYKGIITMDGNNKDGVDGVLKILAELKNGFDFVQGSRFVSGGKAVNTPMGRNLAIRFIHAPITSIASRFRFTDTTNGFRGYSLRFLTDPRVAPLREVFHSYEILAYLPIRASQLGFRIVEVPVTRSYPKEGRTPTKIHGISAHFKMLLILLKAAVGFYRPI